MKLFTNGYTDKNPKRNAELIQAMQRNIDNPLIERIYLIAEFGWKPEFELTDKVQIIQEIERPTFDDFIFWADVYCEGNQIAIIANTDIYFDETLAESYNIEIGECYALSRYDSIKGALVPFHRRDSQDAWMFRVPLPKPKNCNFTMGIPGCDNRFAYELEQVGVRVTNPCGKIKAIHLHESGVRNYTKVTNQQRVSPPYKMVNPE